MKKLLSPLENLYYNLNPRDREYVQYFGLLVVVAVLTALMTPVTVALVALVQAQFA